MKERENNSVHDMQYGLPDDLLHLLHKTAKKTKLRGFGPQVNYTVLYLKKQCIAKSFQLYYKTVLLYVIPMQIACFVHSLTSIACALHICASRCTSSAGLVSLFTIQIPLLPSLNPTISAVVAGYLILDDRG
jgi:hypothetical protein